jgi:hypothetical protein
MASRGGSAFDLWPWPLGLHAPDYIEASGPHRRAERPFGELRGAVVVVLLPLACHLAVAPLDGKSQARAVDAGETLRGPVEGVLQLELAVLGGILPAAGDVSIRR